MIVARDIPLLLGLLAFAVIGFGLVGYAAGRGKLAGVGQPFLTVIAILILAYQVARSAADEDWTMVAIAGVVMLIGVLLSLRTWTWNRRRNRIRTP